MKVAEMGSNHLRLFQVLASSYVPNRHSLTVISNTNEDEMIRHNISRTGASAKTGRDRMAAQHCSLKLTQWQMGEMKSKVPGRDFLQFHWHQWFAADIDSANVPTIQRYHLCMPHH
jgi:hypothetical protein